MINVYEVTYKSSAKSRKALRALRFAESMQSPGLTSALLQDGAIVVSICLVGEWAGPFCAIGGAA